MTTRERAREHRVHRRRTSGPPGRRGCAGAALSLRGSPGYGPLSDVPSRVLRSNAASATHQGFPARAARSLPATHQLVRHLLSTPQPSMQLPSARRPAIGRPTAGPTTAPIERSDRPVRLRPVRRIRPRGGASRPMPAADQHPSTRHEAIDRRRVGGLLVPADPHRNEIGRPRRHDRRIDQTCPHAYEITQGSGCCGAGQPVCRQSWLGFSSELAGLLVRVGGLLVRVDGASHQQPGPVASG